MPGQLVFMAKNNLGKTGISKCNIEKYRSAGDYGAIKEPVTVINDEVKWRN